ncbi:uncharacterized protein LOC144178555 isoform X1 [Haemaphysalis longicornis]
MHHFRERLKEEERRRDEEMLRSYDSWRNPQDNERTDGGIFRNANRLGIRSPTDSLLLDEPVYRLGRRGPVGRQRTDTDPLGLRSGVVQVAPRVRHRPAPASSGDQRPTLEELLRKKTEARNEERLFERRQLEIADTLYPYGRRPESRMAMASGGRRTSLSSSIEEIERYSPWGKGVGNPSPDQNFKRRSRENTFVQEESESPDGTFLIGGHSSAPKPRRFKSLNNMTATPDGDLEDIFPWTRPRDSGPSEKNGNMAGLSFHEKMGWSTSDHAPKKSKEELRQYLDFLKGEMDDRQNRLRNESLQDANSNTSDIVEVMSQSLVGKPPITTALRRRTRHLL